MGLPRAAIDEADNPQIRCRTRIFVSALKQVQHELLDALLPGSLSQRCIARSSQPICEDCYHEGDCQQGGSYCKHTAPVSPVELPSFVTMESGLASKGSQFRK